MRTTKILMGILAVSMVPLFILCAIYFSGIGHETAAETGAQEYTTDTASKNQSADEASGTNDEKNSDIYRPEDFYISEIPDDIWNKMQGRSYAEGCTVPREDLRYVHILHTDFVGGTCEGELIVNKSIAEAVLDIFTELYRAGYPIEKIRLVDEYAADDEASMEDNNTSAFNYRFVEGTNIVSKHGLGLAVDINPFYNPQVMEEGEFMSVYPADAQAYAEREKDFLYKIDHDDLCYRLFTEHGFEWGGDWEHNKDYQHFEFPGIVNE